MNRPTNATRASLWWVLPVVLVGVCLWCLLPREVAYQNDANFYVGGASALAQGLGYRVEPYLDLPPMSQYPPLHSAYLALFWRVGEGLPGSSPWLELAMAVVALAALALLAAILRREGVPVWFGGLCVLLVGTSVAWLDLTALLFSDVSFALLAYALVWFAGSEPEKSQGRPRWWLGVGVLLGLLLLTRSAGIAPVLGLAAIWLYQRESRRLATAVALLAPLGLAFLVKRWASGSEGTYGSYFSARIIELGGWGGYAKDQLGTAWSYLDGRCWVEALFSVPARLRHYPGSLGPVPGSMLLVVSASLGLLLMALMIWGAWSQRNRPLTRAALWVLLLYFGILFVWPFPIGTRGVLAVLPLTLVWLWQGVSDLTCLAGLNRKRPLLAAVAAFMALNVIGNVEVSRRESGQFASDTGRELAGLRDLADWLKQRPGPESLVCAMRDVPVNHLREFLGRRLLANPTPQILRGSFYDVPPTLQGNRTADYVVVRKGGPLTYGTNVFRVEQEFGPFQLCRIGPP